MEALQPSKLDRKKASKVLREHLLELQTAYAKLTQNEEEHFIHNRRAGNQINGKIKLVCDYQLFEWYANQDKSAECIEEKIKYLKRAVDLYRGDLLEDRANGQEVQCEGGCLHSKYLIITEEFLKLLMQKRQFEIAKTYALGAMKTEHSYPYFFAVTYLAQRNLRQHRAAGRLYESASRQLDQEGFPEFLEMISKKT